MKVIKSNVLIKEIKKSDTPVTKVGNFVIPENQKDYMEAEVLSFGEDVSGLTVGDTIYAYPKAGKEIEIDGEKYRVINVSEIIVVL